MTDAPFNLKGSATSGLPVSYTSSNPDVAEVNGNLVSIKGVGAATITARQAGNSDVAEAVPVSRELIVKKSIQFISTSFVPSSVNFGPLPIPLPPTTNGGLPITYTLSDNALASIEGYYLIVKKTGSLDIQASQSGNDVYLPAPSVTAQMNITPIADPIFFNGLPSLTFGDAPFELEAWSTSGLPVTFLSSNSSIASVNGSVLTVNAAGTVNVIASSINPGYTRSQVLKTLIIRKRSQSISFSPLEPKDFGDASFQITATSASGLPVEFTSLSPGVVQVEGNWVKIIGNGVAEIVASQSGDSNWEPAESIHRTFLVTDVGKTHELVGVTSDGGPNHSGVVFSMTSEGTAFKYLKQFDVKTSPNPQAGFMKGADGKFYANFSNGGTGNVGSIVRVEQDGTGLTYLYHLRAGDGINPSGNLLESADGDLFGTTRTGGMHDGGDDLQRKARWIKF